LDLGGCRLFVIIVSSMEQITTRHLGFSNKISLTLVFDALKQQHSPLFSFVQHFLFGYLNNKFNLACDKNISISEIYK
jgi:hypothetical protein